MKNGNTEIIPKNISIPSLSILYVSKKIGSVLYVYKSVRKKIGIITKHHQQPSRQGKRIDGETTNKTSPSRPER
jgi:hypothetical protein